MKDTEIEIKVNVEKSENLLVFLQQNGTFQGEYHQVDEYFSPEGKRFLKARPVEEWLRLRRSSKKQSINYKNWHTEDSGESNYCDEYQTEVGDIEKMKKIFTALKIESLVVVDKLRKTWTYVDYEISIDSVKELGDFVEIEYKGKDKNPDPEKITKEILLFLKDIGCGKIQRNFQGYPFLLLFPKEAKYQEV